MLNITFTTFNFGTSGSFVNGPGTSIYNLCRILKKYNKDINIDVFSHLEPGTNDRRMFNVRPLDDRRSVIKSINNSDILHNWSGLGKLHKEYIYIANKNKKDVFIGPNAIDCVSLLSEKAFLKNLSFKKIFTINTRLRHLISKEHEIDLSRINLLMVGPDPAVWAPSEEKKFDVLWKGNAAHFVKDVEFGISVSKRLPQYSFKFIGYPDPYRYKDHIEDAKSSKIYMCTSLSETMGIALMEQWLAGVPSITHPKIYLHGANYETGIVTNRDLDSYCEAVVEIMSNNNLHASMSQGCRLYMENNFSDKNTYNNYMNIIGELYVG
tara:strand:+ start:100856 stop:101824 length:969 start_codon:yes stop_codon:yes gene_type:complete